MFWSDPSGLVPESLDDFRFYGDVLLEMVDKELAHIKSQPRYGADYISPLAYETIDGKGNGISSGGSVAENSEESRSGVSGSGNRGADQSGGFFNWIYSEVSSIFNSIFGESNDNIPNYMTDEIYVTATRLPARGTEKEELDSFENMMKLLDLMASSTDEHLGKISFGSNHKIYYKGVINNRAFYGNQHVTTKLLANYGKKVGLLSFITLSLLDIDKAIQNEISYLNLSLNLAVGSISYRIGGYWGIMLGIEYELLKYEFQGSRNQFNTYPTGNDNFYLIPAENTKVRKIMR